MAMLSACESPQKSDVGWWTLAEQIFPSSAEDQTLVGAAVVFLPSRRRTPPTPNGMSFATAVLPADMSAKFGG